MDEMTNPEEFFVLPPIGTLFDGAAVPDLDDLLDVAYSPDTIAVDIEIPGMDISLDDLAEDGSIDLQFGEVEQDADLDADGAFLGDPLEPLDSVDSVEVTEVADVAQPDEPPEEYDDLDDLDFDDNPGDI